jgi:hypothetical protein
MKDGPHSDWVLARYGTREFKKWRHLSSQGSGEEDVLIISLGYLRFCFVLLYDVASNLDCIPWMAGRVSKFEWVAVWNDTSTAIRSTTRNVIRGTEENQGRRQAR